MSRLGVGLQSDFETESGVQIRETLPRFSELVKQVKVEQESEGGMTLDHVAEVCLLSFSTWK